MNTTALLAKLRHLDIRLWIENGKLRFSAPKGALSEELKAEIAAQKNNIISFLSISSIDRKQDLPPMKTIDRQGALLLSFAQNRMWFLHQLAPDSSYYNIPAVLLLKGALDLGVLDRVFVEIVRRHEVIRTVYKDLDGQVQQIIQGPPSRILRQEDLSSVEEDLQKELVRKKVEEESQRPFNLTIDLMLRVKVLKLRQEKHVVIFNMHHIASDGWSMGILIKEIVEIYDAFSRGADFRLPELKFQYLEYAAWQREQLSEEKQEEDLSYWKHQLEGVSNLELPTDHPRKLIRKRTAGKHVLNIDQRIYTNIREFAKENGLTTFMVTLGIYQLLLARYTGQTNFCVGTPVAGRQTTDLEPLIGFFVNSLPLRVRYAGTTKAFDYLQQVKESCWDAFAHQDMPFDLLVDKLQLKRDLNNNPIFQIMFSFQAERRENFSIHGLEIEPLPASTGQTNFDLVLTATESGNGLRCNFEYDASLFEPNTVEYMAQCYRCLLESALASPNTPLQQLKLADESTLEKVLATWNSKDSDCSRELSVVELFQQAARKFPENTAIVFENGFLTYKELDERSNQLAHYLKSRGIYKNTLVGISIDPSFDMIIGILAILKAGCAYVPLDPSYPLERLRFMMADSQLSAVITSVANAVPFQPDLLGLFVCVDKEFEAITQQPLSPLPPSISNADALAYVIYTSGSTGQPKNTMLSHQGLVNLLISQQKILETSPDTHFLQFASLSFDASVLEIFVTLSSGGTLVMAPHGTLRNPASLVDLCQRNSVDTALFPPSLLPRLRPEDLPKLRTLIVGGESCPENLARLWSIGRQLFNAYGATEATVCATMVRCEGEVMPPVIGQPLPNIKTYVLDAAMEPLPPGAIGELYLGGIALARGYLGKPGMTAEKFVPDPFSRQPGGRLYRTGDLVRWRPDGRIEFCGRRDEQIKIRGHRIELGEIESTLMTHPGIDQTAVSVLDDELSGKRLVAYIVKNDPSLSANDLRSYVATRLPNYMRPSFIVEMDQLPLGLTGKVNKKALPAPDLRGLEAKGHVDPSSSIEEALYEIFSTVTGASHFSVHMSFFELGGHSLSATKAVSHIKDQLGVEITLVEFFENASVSQLARILDERTPMAQVAPIKPVKRRDFYPCTSAQKRMYILNKIDDQGVSYNIPLVARMTGRLDRERFQRLFSELSERHDSMGTRFGIQEGELVQYIDEGIDTSVEFRQLDHAEIEKEIRSLIRPFNVNTAPLWRATVLQLSQDESILIIDAHHIVVDGLSLVSLVKEFCDLYAGKEVAKPQLQQKDFATWQKEEYLPRAGQQDEEYWRSILSGDLPILRLPTDHPRPVVQSFRGKSHRFSLDKDLSQALREWAKASKSTLFFTLLGIYKILLHKYTGQEDIIVGVPVAGRPHHSLEGTVGMFVNTLALRSFPQPDISASDFLASVKQQALQGFEHQLFPYEDLIHQLDLKRDTSRNPLFDTLFSMIDPGVPKLETQGLLFQTHPLESRVSKFDISLSAVDSNDEIALTFEYCQDLFEAPTIERLSASFALLCRSLCSDARTPIREMMFLSDEERRLLLQEFGQNPVDIDRNQSFIELFKSTVERKRDAVAIIDNDIQLRYDKLDLKSTRLAQQLLNRGVKTGDHIAVVLPRSADAIVNFLAILKAGCVYVPIDPFAPIGRKASIIDDCDPALVLCNSVDDLTKLRDSLPPSPNRKIFTISEELERATKILQFPDVLETRTSQEDVAYIIYTSGSTGKPKGVQISHGSLAHYVQAYIHFLSFTEHDVSANLSSLAFDASVEEISAPLIAGGKIAVFPQEKLFDIDAFVQALHRCKVTIAAPSPLLLSELARRGPFPSVRIFMPGGEKVKTEHLHELRENVTVWNCYGPTETTISACVYKLPSHNEENIPIGRPFPNYELYVLDKHLAPRPVGVPGQLYISGPGVAVGYLNRKELTAQCFIPNPFRPGQRLYASGDLVKWRSDGELLFLGRVDRQVQIRGFRVELGEIESAIDSLSQVKASLVINKGDYDTAQQLVCYYTTTDSRPLSNLRNEIAKRLPAYMIPQQFIHLEQFPTNLSGKIDVNKLPAVDYSNSSERQALLPRTAIEAEVHDLWQRILKLETLNIDENFFDVGGNSLSLIQLHEGINAQFDRNIRLIDLFNNSTIEKMSQLLQTTGKSAVKKTLPTNTMPEGFYHSGSIGMITPSTLRATLKNIDLSAFVSQLKPRASTVVPIHIYLGIMLHLLREYSGSHQSSAHFLDLNNEVTSADIDLSTADDFPALFSLIAQQQQMIALNRIGTIRADEGRSFRPLFTSREKGLEGCDKLLEIFDVVISIDCFESPHELLCTYNEAQLISDKMKSFFKNYVQFLRRLADEHEERGQ